MKDCVYLDFNGDLNICKETPTGVKYYMSVDVLDLPLSCRDIWQFISGCDVVYYNNSLVSLCRLLSDCDIDYDFGDVSLVDVLELETALVPLSLDGILQRRAQKEKGSDLEAIRDIFKAQISATSKDIKTLDEMAQKEDKRVDASGILVQRSGIIYFKKENYCLYKNLGYTQSVLNSGRLPKDTAQTIRELFLGLR